MNSLPEAEYVTFTLTLINERKFLNYNEVPATLMNYEVRRHDRLSSSESTTAEVLTVKAGVPIGRAELIREDRSSDQHSEI